MYLEVRQWPESQEVMEDPDWFFITDGNPIPSKDRAIPDPLGNSAYARIINLNDIIQDAVIAERKRIMEGIKKI